MTRSTEARLGAVYIGAKACRFAVWAPKHDRVELHIVSPVDRRVPLARAPGGMHTATVDNVEPGARYLYDLGGGTERPDPASRFQPEGVHGPSEVVDLAFAWTDGSFRPPAPEDLVLYELHVGTFSESGTFDAVIPELRRLADLGVNALELMPVSAFPGTRNWGYDGVYPWATQASYGGPAGLQRLVDACHAHGIAVALDVVHNHLGPEGNYLADFGNYFSDVYRTPWGHAINFDGPGSDEVRRYFIESTIAWVLDFHVDILRLDAVHAIYDQSAEPYLRALGRAVHDAADRAGSRALLIAESDLNDPRVIRPAEVGGFGLDAQWSDDFHHALHALVTRERAGYYADFGRVSDLARAYREGYVYAGQFSAYRDRSHGGAPDGCPGRRFVVCSQNHDQVGNRATGDRLTDTLSFAEEKLVATVLLLAPYVPLLFMGQEYGETAPFQYFASFGDTELAEAVRRGRKAEFRAFGWPEDAIPDPQDPATFERSRPTRARRATAEGQALEALHRALIRLRRAHPALSSLDRHSVAATVDEETRSLIVRRSRGDDEILGVFAFGGAVDARLGAGPSAITGEEADGPRDVWYRLVDTEDPGWAGSGTTAPEQAPAGATARVKGRSAVIYATGPSARGFARIGSRGSAVGVPDARPG